MKKLLKEESMRDHLSKSLGEMELEHTTDMESVTMTNRFIAKICLRHNRFSMTLLKTERKEFTFTAQVE